MTKELFARIGKSLVPADERAEELLHGLAEGKAVMVDIERPRNPKQHKLFWALMKILRDNCAEFEGDDLEEIAKQIKIDCGAVDWFVHKASGVKFGTPQSIAFASMKQEKFARFLNRAIHVITTQYLPGVSSEAVRERLEDMVHG